MASNPHVSTDMTSTNWTAGNSHLHGATGSPPASTQNDIETLPSSLGHQAVNAFRRDLPALLMEHSGQWVAYRGPDRARVGTTKLELYQYCLAQGWNMDEFIVRAIEPDCEPFEAGVDLAT